MKALVIAGRLISCIPFAIAAAALFCLWGVAWIVTASLGTDYDEGDHQ